MNIKQNCLTTLIFISFFSVMSLSQINAQSSKQSAAPFWDGTVMIVTEHI